MKHDININDGDLQFMKAEVAAWREMLAGFRSALEALVNKSWTVTIKIMGVKVIKVGINE